MSSAELIERHSLTACYYVSLNCPTCGELREALPEKPRGRYVDCPCCGNPVQPIGLGPGGTARTIPFWEKAARHMHYQPDLITLYWQTRRLHSSSVHGGI